VGRWRMTVLVRLRRVVKELKEGEEGGMRELDGGPASGSLDGLRRVVGKMEYLDMLKLMIA
jgi:hypothetical protein